MKFVLFIISIITLILGHYFKVYRQQQLIDIYEKSDEKVLLRALASAYFINSIVPFKVGDLFRAWYSGKRMKNGISFSLSTVIIDRILDIIFVGFLFCFIGIIGIEREMIGESILFYGVLSVLCLLSIVFFFRHNKTLKIIVKKFAGIFNATIEYAILKGFWCIISSFKDIFENVSKRKLLLNTICIWTFYLLSYFTFALSMKQFGYSVSVVHLMLGFFSKNTLDAPTFHLTQTLTGTFSFYFLLYQCIPLISLFVISFLPYRIYRRKQPYVDNKHLELLPHVNRQDKLLFLEAYFSAESRKYFQNYLKINRDICILQDYSAGSNATTMLCTDNTNTFFRKYSFGKDSEKLYQQIEWIEANQSHLSLPQVLNVKHGDGYCSYDMPYMSSSIVFFNYIHSQPLQKSWHMLKQVLEDLEKHLYQVTQYEKQGQSLEEYLDTKVIKNIEKIESGSYIKPLLKYDYLYINGKKYKNLKLLKKYLQKDCLMNIFKTDTYSTIHGDLTIENIICNLEKNDYYIIDPNTGNLHESANLDYAKLLQSLHGNYEFFMNTKSVDVYQNHINYLFTSSHNYKEMYENYRQYLENTFSYEKVRSIYFHEIVHWLRLMPYKIEKNKERSVLFYAGMLIVMNEIIEKYGEGIL